MHPSAIELRPMPSKRAVGIYRSGLSFSVTPLSRLPGCHPDVSGPAENETRQEEKSNHVSQGTPGEVAARSSNQPSPGLRRRFAHAVSGASQALEQAPAHRTRRYLGTYYLPCPTKAVLDAAVSGELALAACWTPLPAGRPCSGCPAPATTMRARQPSLHDSS